MKTGGSFSNVYKELSRDFVSGIINTLCSEKNTHLQFLSYIQE